MTSNIDVTLPVARHPSTVTERANWQAAYDEITALQATVASLQSQLTALADRVTALESSPA
jgi:hypothetical protein